MCCAINCYLLRGWWLMISWRKKWRSRCTYLASVTNDVEYHCTSQMLAATVEEKKIFFARLDVEAGAGGQIKFDLPYGLSRYRYEALFVTLTFNADIFVVEVEL